MLATLSINTIRLAWRTGFFFRQSAKAAIEPHDRPEPTADHSLSFACIRHRIRHGYLRDWDA
jgi:hypothetical protein